MAGFRNDKVNANMTAYAVVCGPTSAPGDLQSIAGVGTSGQVLTSNGAGSLPTFQDAAGGGDWTSITSGSFPAATTLSITSGLGTAYDSYRIVISGVSCTQNETLTIAFSVDGGSNYNVPGNIDNDFSSPFNFGPTIDSGNNANIIAIWDGNKTSNWKRFTYSFNDSISGDENSGGILETTSDIDAIRFAWAGAGNFDAGTYEIFGK